MQAHIEGSPAVGLQVGLNARAAVTAFELARAGFPGPRDILEAVRLLRAVRHRPGALGRSRRRRRPRIQIARMSHKPYPTGRATHSGIGAALRLMREHALLPEDIAGMKVHASSLIVRLVGRPARPGMDSATARLCMGYAVPRPSCMAGWASRISIRTRWPIRAGWNWPPASRCWTTAIDPNAMCPARGTASAGRPLPDAGHARVSGQPGAAAGRSRADAKFRACCASAQPPVPPDRAEALIRRLRRLEDAAELREIVALLSTAD